MSLSSTKDPDRLLAAFETGDFAVAQAWIGDNLSFDRPSNSYAVHPLLKDCVARNGGRCHAPRHMKIAELFLSPDVRRWRGSITEDNCSEALRQVRKTPSIVSAEFTAGPGIARALHHCKSVAMTELVLAAGADIDAQTSLQETPLGMQLRLGTLETAHCLLQHGATVELNQCPHMPSNTLAQRIELLLEYGWKIGQGQVHHDARHGFGKRIDIWLRYGVHPDVQDLSGKTPLHYAAARHSGARIIKSLAEAGADLEIKDHLGQTPLQVAIQSQHKTLVGLLRKLGAT